MACAAADDVCRAGRAADWNCPAVDSLAILFRLVQSVRRCLHTRRPALFQCVRQHEGRRRGWSVQSAADCPGGTFVSNPAPGIPTGDSLDSTGHILKILNLMPRPNFLAFHNGNPDGLNTAQYRWLQGRKEAESTNASIGVVRARATTTTGIRSTSRSITT